MKQKIVYFLMGLTVISDCTYAHAVARDDAYYSSKSEINDERSERSYRSTVFALEAGTQAPVWAGLGGRVIFQRHFAIDAGIGFMPSPYASMIGQTAAYYGRSNVYRLLIENGFQSSRVIQLGARYQVDGEYGWHIGANSYFVHSEGSISLAQVLQSQGFDPSMLGGSYLALFSNADLILMAANLGYTFKIGKNWGLDASLGIAKILSTSVRLYSSVPQFDQTSAGQMVLATASSQVQQILSTYGVTPLLGVNLQYVF